MRHFNIPVFIPGLACPHQCVFCDQASISGQKSIPGPEDVDRIVKEHLGTLPEGKNRTEIAFFGGSFTGLPIEMQHKYLEAARKWVAAGKVDGIRLSTRPDYINAEVMALMQQYGVWCIELGAQSLDDTVLELSGRGHGAEQVRQAAALIKGSNIQLGLQMMTGLPGDTLEKTMATAREIADLGAENTRIYPALVIRNTPLEKLFRHGKFKPLDLEETIERCAMLLDFFEEHNITVLRLGLHPSTGLIQNGDLVAGPWHPALRELALTRLWNKAFEELIDSTAGGEICIAVAPGQLNAAIGYKAANRKMLERTLRKVKFKTDSQLSGRRWYADNC